MRVCSLLPSATEIVFALGMEASLVGVTHECDFPPPASAIAKLTGTNIPPGLSSQAIDASVRSTLDTTGSLYELDLPLLERLAPDLILTQRLCDVCAVSFDRVQAAVQGLKCRPRVLNLEPHSLSDILDTIRTVGQALRCAARAEAVVHGLERRIDAVRQKTQHLAARPRVFCMEWVDPPFAGGHWMKDLVEIAGGHDGLAERHRPSQRVEWRRVLEFSPEVLVLTCCGFSLPRVQQEAERLMTFERVAELPAVQTGRVFATDGSAYFSRPGPRIVESLEILAHLIHSELFPPPPLPGAFAAVNWPPV